MFPFGYGLAYTTFRYDRLSIVPDPKNAAIFSVSFDITNTGGRESAEVPQVYIGDGHAPLQRPKKELKAFVKIRLRGGETKRVTINLDRRAFSYYDAGAKQWCAHRAGLICSSGVPWTRPNCTGNSI